MASPAIDTALRRLLVDLERPRALDEWRFVPPAAVSVDNETIEEEALPDAA